MEVIRIVHMKSGRVYSDIANRRGDTINDIAGKLFEYVDACEMNDFTLIGHLILRTADIECIECEEWKR